jgi:hypothetical protein
MLSGVEAWLRAAGVAALLAVIRAKVTAVTLVGNFLLLSRLEVPAAALDW